MKAAFIPEVNGELDTQNFEKFEEVMFYFLGLIYFCRLSASIHLPTEKNLVVVNATYRSFIVSVSLFSCLFSYRVVFILYSNSTCGHS